MGDPAAVSEDETIRIIRAAIDRGLKFMDNSWDYNDGQSELRMGKALRDGYREKAFLMTKIDGRTKEEASRQIDESLRRLQTDHVDLLQHHEIIRYEDADRIFAEGGAMEAFHRRAGEAGKLRYIGFTGHKDPHVHLYMLEVARQPRISFRHGADAAQCDGRALPQFRETGPAGTGEREHRRARNEEHGQRRDPEEQDRFPDRVPALRYEPPDCRS